MENVDEVITEGDSMFDGDEHDDDELGAVGEDDEGSYDIEGGVGGSTGELDVSGEDTGAGAEEDAELEAIKARVREMEEEAEKIKAMHSEVEKQMLSSSGIGSPNAMSVEDKADVDSRSVWVGNVDYGASAHELEAHFHGCGSVVRVTILTDKFSGHPKGFAYIEFSDKDAVTTATALNESLFRGRQIQVTPKRTNKPGISTTNRAPRGGRMHRGMGRASTYQGGYYAPRGAYRGRGFRARRASYFSPY